MGHTCGGLRTMCEIQFSPPAYGSWGSNSRCQAWQQVAIPSEPSRQPPVTLLVMTDGIGLVIPDGNDSQWHPCTVRAHTGHDPRGNVGAVEKNREVAPCTRRSSSQLHLSPTPDPHSRVCLTSPDPNDPLSSYINANYIRVRSSIPKAFH